MPSFLANVRQDFIGLNDKYLESAILGGEVVDVMQSWLDDHDKDRTKQRLERYRNNWKFYRNEQWIRPVANGDPKITLSECRKIVDKGVNWLFGKEISFSAPPGNEEIAAVVDEVWKDNWKTELLWRIGQMGAVTGDCFVQVTAVQEDRDGNPLPDDQYRIAINLIPSRYVHPIYDTVNGGRMTACLIQFPVRVQSVVDQHLRSLPPFALYSLYTTPKQITEFINREPIPGSPRVNPLGELNIVHIRNGVDGDRWSGISDLEAILPLNEIENAVATNIKSIIDYHEAPTTLIFGARANTLEKGAKKVWSGLPKDAKVENLQLEGDLGASVRFLELVKKQIYEEAEIPEKSLGGDLAISNTSAAALQTALLPLVEKTERKRIFYGNGIKKINRLILKLVEMYLEVDLDTNIPNPDSKYETDVVWPSPFPRDETERLTLLEQKLRNGLESRIGAIRELYPDNTREKAIEILADKREDLLREYEAAVASTKQQPPNLGLYATGSIALSTGLTEAFSVIDEIATQSEIDRRSIDAADEAARLASQPTPTPAEPAAEEPTQ